VANSELKEGPVIHTGGGQVGDRDEMAHALQMGTIFCLEIHSLQKESTELWGILTYSDSSTAVLYI
jgi:hypothetical protein